MWVAAAASVSFVTTTNSSPPQRPSTSDAQVLAQDGGDLDQHLVANVMAKGIVDQLEVIDIKQDDRYDGTNRVCAI